MTETNSPNAAHHHFERLAADADDVVEMLTRQHADGGDLHPEALPKATHVRTSLHEVLDAIRHNEHLAVSADDLWSTLNRRHTGREV